MSEKPGGMYFEDFKIGDTWSTKGRTITETDIVNFAGLSGDFNQLHMDEQYAGKTQFGKRIAHGLLGLAISSGLTQALDIYNDTIIAFLGLTWKFTGPIFIGDTVHVEQTVASLRKTSKPGRGVATFEVKLINQNNETVQLGERSIMIRCREE